MIYLNAPIIRHAPPKMNIPKLCLGTLGLTPDSLKRGLNKFKIVDLAKAYNNEREMGRAMYESGKLAQTTVITKLHEPCLQSLKDLHNAIQDSKDKIGKMPELILVHAPYPTVNMLQVTKFLDRLRQKGSIQAWGVSNFDIPQLDFLKQNGLTPSLNQVECHPYLQRNELALYCKKMGIFFQGYRPLANGNVFSDPVLKEIAAEHNTDCASVVYAWLNQLDRGIVSKVSNEKNQDLYANSGKFLLTNEQMAKIAQLEKPNGSGRTCTKGGWFVPFTEKIKKTWSYPPLIHTNLKLHGDGLNIEGGLIPTRHFTAGKNQIWANIGAVLDCPYHHNLDWKELTETSPYPLKEASLIDYNEQKVCLAHAMTLKYYINNAQRIAQKSQGERVNIVVQIHRGSSGKIQLAQLSEILNICFPGEFKSQPINTSLKNVHSIYHNEKKNIIVELRWGYTPETIGNYEKADIVISLSLVAGFKDNLPTGSLVLPKTFIPLSIEKMTINKDKTYSVHNDAAVRLTEIMKEQADEINDVINRRFVSPNPSKKDQRSSHLTATDFTEVTLFEADGIFAPSTLPGKEFLLKLPAKL